MCTQRSPHLQSAGGFPPAPGSVAFGSAPPFQTQARYCEVSLARAPAESRVSACEASWLPALRDGEKEVTAGLGQSSRRGKHVLPENHTLLERALPSSNLEPLRSTREAGGSTTCLISCGNEALPSQESENSPTTEPKTQALRSGWWT